MAFSFSNWFKKPAGNDQPDEPAEHAAGNHGTATAVSVAPAPPPHPAPPSPVSALTASRPIKTAVPNSVRPVSLHESSRPAAEPAAQALPASVSLRAAGASPGALPAARSSISFPGAGAAAAPASAAPMRVPIAAPPAAPPPPPNAGVTLTLGDFVDRIPANLLRAGAPVDRAREVVFQAQDLYSDLARGRAAVPVSTIQAVCPDLFSRPISETEDVEIPLPLPKLVEQLGAELQTRADQVAGEDVAEIETPFLQVALEDSVRLPKPPVSALPKPIPSAVPPSFPRRPTSRIAAPGVPGVSPLAPVAGADPGVASTMRALTPRSVHINPARTAGAEPLGGPAAEPRPTAPASLTATPGTGVSAPTQSTVAPINPTKRPPSTVRASVAGGKIRLSGPAISARAIAPPQPMPVPPAAPPPVAIKPLPAPVIPAASAPAQKKTARIQIPAISLRPNVAPGGVPSAPPRPAAAAIPIPKPIVPPGSPVSFRATPGEAPTTPASSPAPATAPRPPARLPAPIPPPAATMRPSIGATPFPFPPAPPQTAASVAPPIAAPAAASPDPEPIIALALSPILRSLPAVMFTAGLDGNAAADRVPDDVRVELPLPFITGQLAQGRVAVPRDQFVAAMPENFRGLLVAEHGEPMEVLIPLQEVFQSLPTGALSRRSDQVVDEVGPEIPTPFSMKAKEDAQRLQELTPEPEPEPEPEPLPVASAVEEQPAAVFPEPEASAVAPAELEVREIGETLLPLPVSDEAVAGESTEAVLEDEPPRLTDVTMAPAVAPLVESEISTAAVMAPEAEHAPAVAEAAGPASLEAPELIGEAAPLPVDEPSAPTGETPAPEGEEHFSSEPTPEAVVAAAPAEPTTLEAVPFTEAEIERREAPLASELDAHAEEPVAASAAEVITTTTAEPAVAAEAMEGGSAAPEDHHPATPPSQQAAPASEDPLPAPPMMETAARPEPVDPGMISTPRIVSAEAPPSQEPLASPAGLNGNWSAASSSSVIVEEAQEALRAIFMVDDDLDAKKVVKLVSALPGLKACSVMFADGLKLAGQLESISSSEGFCAMTPPFFRRAGNYARELQLGEIQCVTLQTERTLLSFFMQGDICLSVQHVGVRGFLPGVREKLLSATGELAKIYALPVTH